ncbi:YqaA family protein, partial [Pseudoalteromonas sp.]|uniref:YqaA family protein n=1 Tax=Pseudoalteromonas sp. TaxID=53249 RepID=UPI003562B2B8
MAIKNKIKHKTRQFIDSKHMLTGITVASFLESTIVPIPLEAVLVPLMQARREKLWLIALMATLGCLVGALFGYALGYYLFDLLGDWLISHFSSAEQFDNVKQQMQSQG